MIHYELYLPEGNFTGVIPKPYVTALSGETYKYAGGGRKTRRKKLQKRATKFRKTKSRKYKHK